MAHSDEQTPWTTYDSPLPRVPRLTKIPVPAIDQAAITSSSVSSPSAPDSDCAAEVDELLEGIDRVRIDDLWSTPRADPVPNHAAQFRAGLFAPPDKHNAFASISATVETPSNPFHPSHNLHTNRLQTNRLHTNSLPAIHHHHFPRSKTAPPPVQHPTRLIPMRTPPRSINPVHDFPKLFKVYPCQTRQACLASGNPAECFYYHSFETDRRRPNVAIYKPHMCRFIEEAGGCRKADRCPFSHNDFERRYHPDRFGKETCRDFLRGDCPRRYCTFRHEVSSKVEVALCQMDAMNDKEILQLVLKIDEQKGRALCEKLLRRFGHGKKHSGWKLDGFVPHGRDDQKVKYVAARVDEVKKLLKLTGEKKWATSLKTTSLRDMMSGVRKVAEEIRERCRRDDTYVENGSEVHRLIRAIFSNTNWSCHSQEGDNPFLVTPENQNDAMTALERLVEIMVKQVQVRPNVSDLSNKGVQKKGKVSADVTAVAERDSAEVLDDSHGRREVSALWGYPASLGQMAA